MTNGGQIRNADGFIKKQFRAWRNCRLFCGRIDDVFERAIKRVPSCTVADVNLRQAIAL